jgi:UDP-3-O-[3-hydroxymyristoyl] glucosamine N-acyltransferase
MVVVHTAVSVETGCVLSPGVILNHNSVVHEGCHINCGSVGKARAEIKAGTQTGYNEVCDTEKVEHMKQHENLPVAV